MGRDDKSITISDDYLEITISPSEELDKAFFASVFLDKEAKGTESDNKSEQQASQADPKKYDYAYILGLLKKHIPEEFLNTGVIKDIATRLQAGEAIESRRIAKGTAAQEGKDGKLVLLVKEFGSPAEFQTDAFGFIDYKNVRLFDNIAAGQAVARLYRPKPGVSGRDVFGEVIKAVDGKPCDVRLKEGLELNSSSGENYDEIRSTLDGCLFKDAQVLWVSDTITISGDMDAKMGHVEFVGKVHVKGNVSGKFRLAARKGVEVDGDVEGAELLSSEGSILVKGKVFGSGETKILCRESFFADILSHCLIEAGGAITVRREVRESQLYAAAYIKVKEGFLVLSEIYCSKGVVSKQLGSEGEGGLRIHVVPASQTSSVYRDLALREQQHQDALSLLEAHLGPFLKVRDRVQNLKQPHRSKIEQLFNKYDALGKSLLSLKEKMKAFESDEDELTSAVISYKEACYPGVVLLSESVEKVIKEHMTGPAGFRYNSEIQDFISCDFVDFGESSEKEKTKG